MNERDSIDEYLDQFARLWPGDALRGSRALREIEDHLRDRADQLKHQSMEPAAAAATAVERFGSPTEVLRQFELQAPLESEVRAMLRFALTFTAAITSAFAAMFFIFSWFDDAGPTATAMKVIVSSVIIAYNLVLLRHQWMHGTASPGISWFVLAGALVLIAIGSAGFVWTAHLGLITGDWEAYGFVMGALLIFQGALAVGQSKVDENAARKLTI